MDPFPATKDFKYLYNSDNYSFCHISINSRVPAFVGTSSLAYDVGNDIDFMHDIEKPLTPDRQQWLNDYAHTEWATQEISQGIPLNLLTDKL